MSVPNDYLGRILNSVRLFDGIRLAINYLGIFNRLLVFWVAGERLIRVLVHFMLAREDRTCGAQVGKALHFLLFLFVVLVHMVVEVALGHEGGLAVTQLADIGPNAGVRADMRFEITFLFEAFTATLKRTLIRLCSFLYLMKIKGLTQKVTVNDTYMSGQVHFQSVLEEVRLVAVLDRALQRLLVVVDLLVVVQGVYCFEAFLAGVAYESVQVLLQNTVC